MSGGGFGGGPWGGGPWGGAAPISPSVVFDVFCFFETTMPGILTDPNTTIVDGGGQFAIDGNNDLIIVSGGGASTANAQLFEASIVPSDWTLEFTVRFDDLPSDFSSIVTNNCFIGTTDAAGPCAGLFFSQIGMAYAGAVHFDGFGNLILDSAFQQIPGSNAYITTGDYITVRIAVSSTIGAVYIYVTKTADLGTIGYQLRAILPTIDAGDLAFPPVDRTTVSVRGTLVEPTNIALDSLCLASYLIAPNLAPTADAGEDQAIRSCSIAQLDGSGSTDPEGAPLAYQWRLIDAPSTSEFVINGNDGFTVPIDLSGFTNKFHTPNPGGSLASLIVIDPVVAGDVLLVQGVPRTVVTTGIDGTGYYLLFGNQDIPDTLGTNEPFKVLRQRGISNPTTVSPTFFPDVAGFYKFDLVVSDGVLLSDESAVILNVLESVLPRGCTPDVEFIFDFLTDFWDLVEEKDVIPVFWSGIVQTAATEIFTLWQYEYSKSLRDVQRQFVRRWLHYDLVLGEPLPEVTKIRVIFGGIESEPIPVGGVATGNFNIDISSSLFTEVQTIFISVPSGVLTRDDLAVQLINRLAEVDPRFAVVKFDDSISTNQYLRIDAPFPFAIDTTSTVPGTVFTTGQENRHPFDTVGGASVGTNTYKVNRSLKGLDIIEDDFLSLAGIAYRVVRLISDPSDAFPLQRVVVKEILPIPASTAWDITGYVQSELLNFYDGLVSARDRVFFEVVDSVGDVADTIAEHAIKSSNVLGASAARVDRVAFDPLVIGGDVARSDAVSVLLAKVLRRTYIPIDELTQDVPLLSAKIVNSTQADEEAVLRRNVDFFLETFRGQTCIRFMSGNSPDVWEGQDPPDRLWAEYTFIDNRPLIEENFGIPAEFTLDDLSKLPESVDYLSAVRGLWYAYFNGPTPRNIRTGAQILLGLPFAEVTGTVEEIRTDFSPTTGRILLRDKSNTAIVRSYSFPKELSLETNLTTGEIIKVGDEVKQFAPLVIGVGIADWVNEPRWFDGLRSQGDFYEIQKYHTFLVRVDSRAFDINALSMAQNFVLKIKPTYTSPIFLVQYVIEPDEVSVTDEIIMHGTLRFEDVACGAWVGEGLSWDEYDGHGDIRSRYDADPSAPPPTYPVSETVKWGYDKGALLCPDDCISAVCCVEFAVPTTVTYDSCLHFDEPVNQGYVFRDVGPFVIPSGIVGLSLTPLTATTAIATGTLTSVRLIINGGPAADLYDYELIIAVNGTDQATVPFRSVAGSVIVTAVLAVPIVATDVITARIRNAVAGRITVVQKSQLIDGETFTLDDGTNPAKTFEYDLPGDGVSGSNVAIDLTTATFVQQVRDATVAAINAAALLNITAYPVGIDKIGLVHDSGNGGTQVAITETVVDAGFVVEGMTDAARSPGWISIRANIDQPGVAVWTFDEVLPAGAYCSEHLLTACAPA